MTMRRATSNKYVARLSDRRAVRALKGTFTQEQMFGLHKSGLFDPATEKLMGIKEHDDSLNKSRISKKIDVQGWWRTDRYVAYRRGFEKEDIPVGDKLVYFEFYDGRAYTLEIPDVPVSIIRPDGRSEIIGLRQAKGMLDFDLAKLEYDPKARIVSAASDFNPETDVRVIDIMRPGGFALVDAYGYPLRSKPSDWRNPDARYSKLKDPGEFVGESTGIHCSAARNAIRLNFDSRIVKVDGMWWWCDSGVAVVDREPAPEIRFNEPHSQSPYRDAPGIMDSHESRVLGPEDEPKNGMLKRLSLALGFG